MCVDSGRDIRGRRIDIQRAAARKGREEAKEAVLEYDGEI